MMNKQVAKKTSSIAARTRLNTVRNNRKHDHNIGKQSVAQFVGELKGMSDANTAFEYAVMALAQVAERMGMDKADAMVAVSDALEVG